MSADLNPEQVEALATALADSWLEVDCAEVAGVIAPTVAALVAQAVAGAQAETDARLLPLRRYVESHIVTARARGLDTEQDWLDALALLDRS